ncbi:10120_t:CDS:2 [Diversispora eburnea]|uniref:10120_t:CDS:1 n=1 Tax=Diversispora eburnea TaxID=1213867 RepID=A0A9N8YV03_9GLOM|nr:10120_t:CDS:2 [Diversispora eburnea]
MYTTPFGSWYQNNSIKIIMSNSGASRLQCEMVDLLIPRSLDEVETMLCNRPFHTEENNMPVNFFASMLTDVQLWLFINSNHNH